MPTLKNRGPLLVDKVRGYFDRLPDWLRGQITVRIEKQKVDAKIEDLSTGALDSELKQDVTDEKLLTNKFIGDGKPGTGNDLGELPVSNLSQIVIPETGQVADVTETVSSDEVGLVEGPPLHAGSSEQVGDVWVTKKVEVDAFDDKIFQLTRQDLIPPEFRALVPEKLEAHTVDGTAALPTLGAGETVRREEQKKVGIKTVSVQSRDMSSTPVLVGEKVDPQWNGAVLDLEQKIVPAATTITQAFGTTDASIKPIDGTYALQETWKTHAAGTFPQIILKKFDANLQQEVWTYLNVVQQGTAFTDTGTIVDYEDTKIDAVHSLRRVDRAVALATYGSYTTKQFTFPAILTNLTFALVPLAAANRSEPQWAAAVRAAFTAPAAIYEETAFFTTMPAFVTLFTWAPTDIMFKGISYSMNLSNVLCDTWSGIGVTYAADTYYGNTIDRFSITATAPSATTYITAINTTVPISCVIDVYKKLWVRKTSYVTLR